MIRYSEAKGNVVLDEVHTNGHFKHSAWRICLILLALASFILTCVFNGLASTGPNGVFLQRTGVISDNNLTEFTPSGWTFSIWGLIYFWQAAWLIYSLSCIPRKSKMNYLYVSPNTLHYSIFVIYALNMGLNIAWLILWDRTYFGWALLVIFFMLVTILTPMIITHILLQRNRPMYINSNQKLDIWLVRILVHNGFAIYGTWLYLATLLNLTIWISQIYGRNATSITDASTAALTLVLVGILVYFICENFIFYSSMAYTFLPWFVFIFALSGVLAKNYDRLDIPSRNKSYVLALLIIACGLFVVRLVIFILRYMKRKIPTIQDP